MSGASPALRTLLVESQRRLEALYALESLPPVTDFLLDERQAGAWPGGGSRVLVTQHDGELEVGVVLEPGVASCLERHDPRQRLDRLNLGPFCTLIEEVSHFVCLLFCAASARSVTELELELQGEVDKYLSVVCLLSLQNEGAVSGSLRALLFREYRLVAGLDAQRAARYHAAAGLAFRYCGFLEAEYLRRARLLELRREARRFYRLGQTGKLQRIAAAGRG